MGDMTIRALRARISGTDIARVSLILILALASVIVTVIEFSRGTGFTTSQLFYVPILYAVYAYPKRGIFVAGACGVVFEFVGYFYAYPDLGTLTGISIQAILFIVVACVLSYLIGRIRTQEAEYRALFVHSQLGIVFFDRTGYAIRQTNEKFTAMLHIPVSDLRKMTFPDLFFTPREKERFFERIAQEPETADFETRFTTRQGEGCWVNLSWAPVNETTVSCTVIDINTRKFAEKVNNDTMMKYRQLTEHSPTGILVVEQQLIRYANPSFVAFSGYPVPYLVGRRLDELVDPRDGDEFRSFWKQTEVKIPRPIRTDVRFCTKSGDVRIASLSSTPITHTGKPASLVTIVDNSEKQMLVEQIQSDKVQRRGIIVTVAHELRTPLQPILGYLNLLLADPEGFGIGEETMKILGRCLASVDRERQIINQMLEFSVLDTGRLQLSYSEFSLAALIRRVIAERGYEAKASITIQVTDEQCISADEGRLYGVIGSILDNAVSYSRPPRQITISYHSGDADSGHHIAIQDSGIGIDRNALESIFEPFQLADGSLLSRKFERIGLSLSIARKICQLHGGDITAESEPGRGSTFTIHLPKNVPEQG